jgi:hypothetical protein
MRANRADASDQHRDRQSDRNEAEHDSIGTGW